MSNSTCSTVYCVSVVLVEKDEQDGVTDQGVDQGVDGIGLVDEPAVVTNCYLEICFGNAFPNSFSTCIRPSAFPDQPPN